MTKVTLFNNLLSTTPSEVTLAQVFDRIRTDQDLQLKTELHRGGVGQKQKVPAFVPSALMAGGRRQEHVRELTGLLYFDYDHLSASELPSLLEALAACTYVVGFYRSLGGSGLHVIVSYRVFYYDMQPMPLSELDFCHSERSQRSHLLWNAVWEEVRRQFEEFINTLIPRPLSVDRQCKDVARPSAMAYDPDARLYVDSSHPFTVILSKALLDFEGSKPHLATGQSVGRPAKTSTQRAFDAAEEFAKSQGFEPKHGTLNKYVSTVIYEVNRYGVSQGDALSVARERYFYYGDGQRGITSIVSSIYKTKAAEFGTLRLPGQKRSADQKPKRATSSDIEAFLLRQGTFRRNVISHRLEVRWMDDSPMVQYYQQSRSAYSLLPEADSRPVTYLEVHDSDVATLMRLMAEETGLIVMSPTEVHTVLQSDTCSSLYNPILEYLKPLQGLWHPGDRDYLLELSRTIELEGGDEDRALLDDFFKRWMVGMVHGWIRMSSTHGTILTLIGPQGIGKSSWMRMLLPPALRAYYKEQMRYRNLEKDDRIQLAECALINLEEIDAMGEQDVNQLKSLATLDVIRERLPYGKVPVTMPRIATFCATGNRQDFLTDPTGNRRWLAFKVRRLTVDPFSYRPDYEQIYAQALYLAQHEAEMFVMSQQDIRQLDRHNEQFVSQSMEVEMCSVYVHPGERDESGHPRGEARWMTASEIASSLAYFSPSSRLSIRSIGVYLRSQKFETRISRGIRQYLVSVYR